MPYQCGSYEASQFICFFLDNQNKSSKIFIENTVSIELYITSDIDHCRTKITTFFHNLKKTSGNR